MTRIMSIVLGRSPQFIEPIPYRSPKRHSRLRARIYFPLIPFTAVHLLKSIRILLDTRVTEYIIEFIIKTERDLINSSFNERGARSFRRLSVRNCNRVTTGRYPRLAACGPASDRKRELADIGA